MSFEALALTEGPLAAAYLLTLGALAAGMIEVPKNRRLIARNCFLASCVIFAGMGFMWGISTDVSILPRMLVVGVLWGLAGIAAVESGRFIMPHEKSETKGQPAAATNPATSGNPAPPLQVEARETVKPLYYAPKERDEMLVSLRELQLFYKPKPVIDEAISKMIRRRTGVLQPLPYVSEYPSIADGLDRYVHQLRDDEVEARRIVKDADDFVRSALPPESQGTFFIDNPFCKALLDAAEALRSTASKTNDMALAGAAINIHQRRVLDEFVKYAASIQSIKQKITEKIADLRSR